ncbi:hypothetical protein QJQ45_024847, partial [Haematococcus lacustris]
TRQLDSSLGAASTGQGLQLYNSQTRQPYSRHAAAAAAASAAEAAPAGAARQLTSKAEAAVRETNQSGFSRWLQKPWHGDLPGWVPGSQSGSKSKAGAKSLKTEQPKQASDSTSPKRAGRAGRATPDLDAGTAPSAQLPSPADPRPLGGRPGQEPAGPSQAVETASQVPAKATPLAVPPSASNEASNKASQVPAKATQLHVSPGASNGASNKARQVPATPAQLDELPGQVPAGVSQLEAGASQGSAAERTGHTVPGPPHPAIGAGPDPSLYVLAPAGADARGRGSRGPRARGKPQQLGRRLRRLTVPAAVQARQPTPSPALSSPVGVSGEVLEGRQADAAPPSCQPTHPAPAGQLLVPEAAPMEQPASSQLPAGALQAAQAPSRPASTVAAGKAQSVAQAHGKPVQPLSSTVAAASNQAQQAAKHPAGGLHPTQANDWQTHQIPPPDATQPAQHSSIHPGQLAPHSHVPHNHPRLPQGAARAAQAWETSGREQRQGTVQQELPAQPLYEPLAAEVVAAEVVAAKPAQLPVEGLQQVAADFPTEPVPAGASLQRHSTTPEAARQALDHEQLTFTTLLSSPSSAAPDTLSPAPSQTATFPADWAPSPTLARPHPTSHPTSLAAAPLPAPHPASLRSPSPSPHTPKVPAALPPPTFSADPHHLLTSYPEDVFVLAHDMEVVEGPGGRAMEQGEVAQLLVQFLRQQAQQPSPLKLVDLEKWPKVKARNLDITTPHDSRRFFACDTEVAYINIKTQSPVGHGVVNCFSIYCGPDVDFREALPALAGRPGVPQDRLWVDVWDEVELEHPGGDVSRPPEPVKEGRRYKLKTHHPKIAAFKAFFEDDSIPKARQQQGLGQGPGAWQGPSLMYVWHNYSFDRHVLGNLGIECKGFEADTMHMARLYDASRSGRKGYGLDSLTEDRQIMTEVMEVVNEWRRSSRSGLPLLGISDIAATAKFSYKTLFGSFNTRQDGTIGKVLTAPEVHELHSDLKYRYSWADYSAKDAKATWELREALYRCLKNREWRRPKFFTDPPAPPPPPPTSQSPVPAATTSHSPNPTSGLSGSPPTTSPASLTLALHPEAAAGLGPAATNNLHLTPDSSFAAALAASGEDNFYSRVGYKQAVGGRKKGSVKEKRVALQPQAIPPLFTNDTMYEMYRAHWVNFGRVLTDMEQAGMWIDREHLRLAEVEAEKHQEEKEAVFKQWVQARLEAVTGRQDRGFQHVNAGSGAQIRQLLFPNHPGNVAKPPSRSTPEPFASSPAPDSQASSTSLASLYSAIDMAPGSSSGDQAVTEQASDSRGVVNGDSGGEGEGSGVQPAGKKGEKAKAAKVEPPPLAPGERVFKMINPDYDQQLAAYQQQLVDWGSAAKARAKLGDAFAPRPIKNISTILQGIYRAGAPQLVPEVMTASKAAAVGIPVLKGLAGKAGAASTGLQALQAEVDALEPEERAEFERAVETRLPAVEPDHHAIHEEDDLMAAMREESYGEGQDLFDRLPSSPRRSSCGADASLECDVEDEKAVESAAAAAKKQEEMDGNIARFKDFSQVREECHVVHVPTPCRSGVASIVQGLPINSAPYCMQGKGFGKLFPILAAGDFAYYQSVGKSDKIAELLARQQALLACQAVEALCEISAIDKLLTGFIRPLQSDDISTPVYEHELKRPHQQVTVSGAAPTPASASDAPADAGPQKESRAEDAKAGELPLASADTADPSQVEAGEGARSSAGPDTDLQTEPGALAEAEAMSCSMESGSPGSISGLEALEAAAAAPPAPPAAALSQPSSTPKIVGWRIHSSLNLNTETGRLSARRPNLQNQPALEKDRYKVRKAFGAAPGNVLVVADYGQLELRILAHIADCKSMLEAFEKGGDFHSRTALGMYDHIKEAIKNKEVFLEKGDEGAPPDAVLLKDKFASERRKAKILNFSIAYGKTAHGLAKDFGTSLQEAEATVAKWYGDRAEVLKWQKATKEKAKELGKDKYTLESQRRSWHRRAEVFTLLGRSRPLPDITTRDFRKAGHAERAAINTPIQGSAADVASSAMVAIAKCPYLKQLGYTLLMQVHDEVILEGPAENAAAAQDMVVKHMANPWANPAPKPQDPTPVPRPLLVELAVDCDSALTWYEAK